MTMLLSLHQQPEQAADPGGFWRWLYSFCSEPGGIELLLTVALVGCLVFTWWRLTSLVKNSRAREALSDYLLGVEQALQGDLAGAEKRLTKVLEQDPENHYARLLLGKVLAERGQAEQAHQQHLTLKRAFQVDSGENDLMLAQSLLAFGSPEEAAEVAERALTRMPQSVVGWEFLYRARLQHGDHEAAVRAGKKLLSLLGNSSERDKLRADLARTVAEVGTRRWMQGDARTALQSAKEAEGLDASVQHLPLLSARLQAQDKGIESTARELSLAASSGEAGSNALVTTGASVASVGGDVVAASGAGDGAAASLPMATFAGLLEPHRWTCEACSGPLSRDVAQCPRCGASGSATLVEPNLVAAIESATEAMDRIDVNDAHVQRLVRSLAKGDDRARGDLLHLGERAVDELLRTAWRGAGRVQDEAVSVLKELGPAVAPALFAASDAIGRQRLLPVGSGPEAVVGCIVQSYDREALPHMQPLFASSRPDHRRILIDYFLGLGDVVAFQSVLERFPPMEILHRLNHAESAVLTRFLGGIPRGHFLAASLLLEHTFYRDDALLAAVPDADDPEVLVQVMLARGPTRSLTTGLIDGVSDDGLAATSQRVLEELGEQVLEHVLAAFADPDASEQVQKRLARVLVRGGAEAAIHIAAGFGPEPTMLDDRLRELLVIIGDAAVEPMCSAYDHSGLWEKVTGGLVARLNNRRVQITRALGELATKPAHKALKSLRKREKDDNLRLHLERALHGAGGADG